MRGRVLRSVGITADSVRRGDFIHVGGRVLPVVDLADRPGGGKAVWFRDGETLTLTSRTRLSATRYVCWGDDG